MHGASADCAIRHGISMMGSRLSRAYNKGAIKLRSIDHIFDDHIHFPRRLVCAWRSWVPTVRISSHSSQKDASHIEDCATQPLFVGLASG